MIKSLKKLFIASLIRSVLGVGMLFSIDRLGYGENVFLHLLGLWGFQIMLFQLWIIIIYLIIYAILLLFNIKVENVFFGLGLVEFIVVILDFLISKNGDLMHFNIWKSIIPSVIFMIIGIGIWLINKVSMEK